MFPESLPEVNIIDCTYFRPRMKGEERMIQIRSGPSSASNERHHVTNWVRPQRMDRTSSADALWTEQYGEGGMEGESFTFTALLFECQFMNLDWKRSSNHYSLTSFMRLRLLFYFLLLYLYLGDIKQQNCEKNCNSDRCDPSAINGSCSRRPSQSHLQT